MEIAVIFILTLFNGFFALSEIALVSVKRSRIEHLAANGSSKAKIVLQLLENPANFLSSVQVGITLIGIISGAYGGATLTDDMELLIATLPFLQEYHHAISLVLVIGGITYFSIIIGELVPKTIAMNHAESIALFCVPIIKYFTLLTYPFVKLLSVSTSFILKLFGIKDAVNEKISEEELIYMLKTAGSQGILEKEESEVHHNLFSFTDQTAKSLMTKIHEVEWVNAQQNIESIYKQMKDSIHSKFIVGDGSINKIMGVITIKEFLENYLRIDFELLQIIQPPIFIPQNTPAFKILNLFKNRKQYIGTVIDENKLTIGIVTLHDLTEAIVGDLPEEDESVEQNIIKRGDGSYLIDGKTSIHELNQYFQSEIIEDNFSQYTTISGFVLTQIKPNPKSGAKFTYRNLVFEIVDMDASKIDKVLLTKIQ